MSIKLEEVSYRYGQNTSYETLALDRVSIEIGDGEFLGVVGHTGSGKSTLVQQLNGLLSPTEGRILLDGQDLSRSKQLQKQLRSKVGMVFQYPEQQLFEKTVMQDVCFGPLQQGHTQEEAARQAKEALELVCVNSDCFHESPHELSGGQQRRVAIAGVLAMAPEVLVLDEPTAGLDPVGRREILGPIRKLNKEGITVVLVSHNMEDVAEYCNRMIVMDRGSVRFDGTPASVFQNEKELIEIGIRPPETVCLLHHLQKRGVPVSSTAISPEEAADALYQMIQGGEEHE